MSAAVQLPPRSNDSDRDESSGARSALEELRAISAHLGNLAEARELLAAGEVEDPEKSLARILRETAELATHLTGSLPAAWSQYILARTAFESDSALADTLGVNRSRVARWKQGEAADPENEERLRHLGVVVSLLAGYLDRRAIPDWLTGVNPHLGHRRPIDVLMSGRLSEVVAAVEAEISGAYA